MLVSISSGVAYLLVPGHGSPDADMALVAHHKGVWVSGDRSTGNAPKDVSIAFKEHKAIPSAVASLGAVDLSSNS